jgi:superoxide reductase
MENITMDRRYFLLGSAATAATLTISGCVEGTEEVTTHIPPKNLLFTQDNAGDWEAKKGSHSPVVEVADGKARISTKHSQSEDHYIVRHTLLLADGAVVGATTFSPTDEPVSEYELPAGYKGRLFATSFCNRHDLWLAESSV